LTKKTGEKTPTARWSRNIFTPDKPGNLVSVVQLQHFIIYKAMYRFCDAIKANKNVGLKISRERTHSLSEIGSSAISREDFPGIDGFHVAARQSVARKIRRFFEGHESA
jgi:hypothetical protein